MIECGVRCVMDLKSVRDEMWRAMCNRPKECA